MNPFHNALLIFWLYPNTDDSQQKCCIQIMLITWQWIKFVKTRGHIIGLTLFCFQTKQFLVGVLKPVLQGRDC